MLKANYHTHLKLCNHAVGMTEDYVKVAIQYGFKEIAITDHNPIPEASMTKKEFYENLCNRNMSLDDFYNVYLKDLDNAKKKYGDKIKIYSGLECEYLPGLEFYYAELKKKVDFLNLGIHFFPNGKKIINTYDSLNKDLIKIYADTACKAMDTGLYKVLVHPDLFMFDYKSDNGNREFDSYCEEVTRRIVEKSIEKGIYLEINANGINNSKKYGLDSNVWLYPEVKFWKIVKEYKDALVIVGADAHNPESLVSENVELVQQMAKNIGLKVEDFIKF